MILGLDLETTGLKTTEDRIIEMCCGLYADDGSLIKNVTLRFNPCRPIDAKAQAVHKIRMEDLLGCPKFSEKAELVGKLLSKATLIVIHNARFDAPFVASELMRCGVTVPNVPVYDTMTESRWATFDGKLPTLGELCWSLNVTYEPEKAHAADYDVNCMMECFFKLCEKDFFSGETMPFNQIEAKEGKK